MMKKAKKQKNKNTPPLTFSGELSSLLKVFTSGSIEPNLQRIWETLEMGEDDILVPFSTQDDEGKYTVWDMIEMMRAGELYYSDDEESEETEE